MSVTHMYPQKVVALFEKNLEVAENDWLSYESMLADEWGNEEAVSVTLDINDLVLKEFTEEWWFTHQPNAIKLLQGKKANLVICYGLAEELGKETKQEITLNKDGNAFIVWRVDSLDFLNGVASALNRKGKVWVKIDMFCDDSYFENYEVTNSYRVNLYKISINFAQS